MENLVGRPYAFPSFPPETFDCWSLLVYVRAQLGEVTPLSISPSRFNPETMRDAVEVEKGHGFWRRMKTEEVQNGDAVLFVPDHIGVFLGTGVLHAHAPSRSVVFTKWPVVLRRWSLVEVWRP